MKGGPQRGSQLVAGGRPILAGEIRPGAEAPRRTRGLPWRRRAFTLFEVILVIALMAVAGTLFLVSVESLGKSSPADEFEGAFWRALAQAREQALTTRRPVELTFDAKEKSFLLDGAGGQKTVPLPAEVGAKEDDLGVTFSLELPSTDFVLVRGALVTRRPVEAVMVFPDGSCQAFAVEFQLRTYKHLVQIDPWTGAEMLTGDAGKKGRT